VRYPLPRKFSVDFQQFIHIYIYSILKNKFHLLVFKVLSRRIFPKRRRYHHCWDLNMEFFLLVRHHAGKYNCHNSDIYFIDFEINYTLLVGLVELPRRLPAPFICKSSGKKISLAEPLLLLLAGFVANSSHFSLQQLTSVVDTFPIHIYP
jgi:hypothetical protein